MSPFSTKISDVLGKITLKMISSLHLPEVLTAITQGLVDEFDAAFARIWLVGPGDRCEQCVKADVCDFRERCLHLEASAGIYTRLNGEYSRVPIGALKIGKIAREGRSILTNEVLNDERLPNKAWLKENRFHSFAGYPLLFRDDVLGVMAMFSERVMTQSEFDDLAIFANQAAIAIQNARLYEEISQLNQRLTAENSYLQEEIKLAHNFEEIISQSEGMNQALRKIEQVAATDATVLILGETGTGKELIARAIHYLSPRKARPLVKVNCAALPANLIESELFGHEKGAFTGALARKIGRFELADQGTIFLDEIGDLPLDLQSKLLRVLQEGEFERLGDSQTRKVNTRIIAATNRDLEAAIRNGEFREDLFYRLNVFPLHIPPLRERKEDIPLLVRHFANKYAAKIGRRIERIPQKAIDALSGYHWPGNIRELENVIERSVILSTGITLNLDEIFLEKSRGKIIAGDSDQLEVIERTHILKVLDECNWRIDSKDGAAARLGLPPSTLRGRMAKLGIKKP